MTKIFFSVVFFMVLCNTANATLNSANSFYKDTIYFVSTQELQSDTIPDSILQMTQLKHLSIYGMDCDFGGKENCWAIKEIPGTIKNLKELTSLQLILNAIKTIPNELSDLKKLVLIDLSDNVGLTDMDNITKIQTLQYLYLYGCGLTRLPDDIANLKNLKELGLTGNNFSETESARIKKALPNCSIKF